jgi:hypothetical protein
MTMKLEELEAKIKALTETVDELKVKLKDKELVEEQLAVRLRNMEDIESIKKLQRAYCYYLEHWQEKEIIGLWSHSPEVSVELNETGLYKGWKAVKKSFSFPIHYTGYNGEKTAPPEFLHLIMPLAGIVDVDSDGKNANARWYSLFHGALYRGGKLRAIIGAGIWENEYIKEHGIWKFKKLFFNNIFSSPYEDGWVKTPYVPNPPNQDRPAPGPNTHFATYPAGYIFPYHYKNPVTGL